MRELTELDKRGGSCKFKSTFLQVRTSTGIPCKAWWTPMWCSHEGRVNNKCCRVYEMVEIIWFVDNRTFFFNNVSQQNKFIIAYYEVNIFILKSNLCIHGAIYILKFTLLDKTINTNTNLSLFIRYMTHSDFKKILISRNSYLSY